MLNNHLYFACELPNSGSELCSMDANFRIQQVRDIAPGSKSSNIGFIRAGSRFVYFSAEDSVRGLSFWRSDGTSMGTIPLADPYPDRSGNELTLLDGAGDHTAFVTEGERGYHLWVSDGTVPGTRKIASAKGFVEAAFAGSRLFLSRGTYNNGTDLYVYDSSQPEPNLVKNIRSGNAWSSPENLIVHGDHLYFTAQDQAGFGIWKTDGKKSWVIHRGRALRMEWTKDSLYFVDQGKRLYRITGEERLERIQIPEDVSQYGIMRSFQNKLIFTTARELWITDGTDHGTHPIKGVGWDISHVEALGNTLFAIESGYILWHIDPGRGRARKVFRVSGKWMSSLRQAKGNLYFIIRSHDRTEFWTKQGATGPLKMIAELGSNTNSLLLVYPRWFFNLTDSTHGDEIHALDLSNLQLTRLGNGLKSRALIAVGNVLVFTSSSTMWRSDGTQQGTFPLGIDSVTCIGTTGSELYLSSDDPFTGNEPYVTDTRQVVSIGDLYRGPYSSDACGFTRFNGSVYFAATDSRHGRELWRIKK